MNAAGRYSASDYLPIAVSVLIWAWGTPLFKYLQASGCDFLTMCFYRSFAAALGLTAWVCWRQRAELRAELARPGRYVMLGVLFTVGLVLFVAGAFETTATLSILLTRAIPLITILLSAILFRDERRLIFRRRFLVGFAVAAAGLVGLCLSREDASGGLRLTAGAGILLASAVVWGVYSAAVKSWLAGRPPFVASMLVFWVTAILLLPALLRWGNPAWIVETSAWNAAILVVSGPILMGLTEGLYYVSIRRIGLAPSTAATLIVPLLTALYAWPVLGEVPKPRVAAFGAFLLGGLGLILWARMRLAPPPQDGLPEPIAGRQGAAAVVAGVAVKGKE